MDLISQNIEYYKLNRKEFEVLYAGKFLIVKDMAVAGVYNTRTEAKDAGVAHETGTYIIERPFAQV